MSQEPRIPSNLLWGDFLSQVLTLMGIEGQRQGTGVADMRLGFIRQGVIHLQTLIDQYRENHETVYQPQDLVTEGNASRGVKPPQSVIRSVSLCKTCNDSCLCGSAWGQPPPGPPAPPIPGVAANPAIIGTGKCVRWDTNPWDWADRFALVQGRVAVNNNRGLFCPDPQGYTFYVYPEVFDCWLLSVHWDGLKVDFHDGDETPFTEQTAMAVATYAKAWMKLEVEERPELFANLMAEFKTQIRLCRSAEREKTQGT